MTSRTIGQLVAGFMMMVLFTLPSPAGVVRQVTDLVETAALSGVIDDSGSAVFLISTEDPYGTNPNHYGEIFRFDPVTGEGEQITHIGPGISGSWSSTLPLYSVTDDGSTVVFASRADPVGANPDYSQQLFLVDDDGSNLRQLTDISPEQEEQIYSIGISGSGNRIVFQTAGDLLGTNPQRIGRVYVIDSDGTNLRQLDFGEVHGAYSPTISDDGNRIAFASREGTGETGLEIFRILADGTGRLQLTSTMYNTLSWPRISGDGSTIAFTSSIPIPGSGFSCTREQIAVVKWDGTGLLVVAAPCAGAAAGGRVNPPDITDDGATVFYTAEGFGPGIPDISRNWDVYRVESDGTGWTQLTDTGMDLTATNCWLVRVSGDGSTITFNCYDGNPFGGFNEDLGWETYAGSGAGLSDEHRQLTNNDRGDSFQPDLANNGSRIVYVSDADPLNEPGDNRAQLYSIDVDGSGLSQLTSFLTGAPKEPSITDDGGWVVFSHNGDPFGTNNYAYHHILAIRDDGTDLRQLTPAVSGNSVRPRISANGSHVVFRSDGNLLEETLYSSETIYSVGLDGTGLTRLSENVSGTAQHPRVDAVGQFAVYTHNNTVYRVGTDGTGRQALSGSGYADWPDISADGTMVVYQEASDSTLTDARLYLWEQSTGVSRPLTATSIGLNMRPVFQGDGAWVHFWSNAYASEYYPGPELAMWYRLELATGTVELFNGFISYHWAEPPDTWEPPMIAVGTDGSRAAFSNTSNYGGNNGDYSLEIFAIDRNAMAQIRISPGPAPTTVSWDYEPGVYSFDVIRGDAAQLAPDGSGGVDLGAVLCIEDDSWDSDTSYDEDLDTPLSGQVLFYLYRSSPGPTDPGSYGTSSSGEERLPSAGDCQT